MQIYPGLSTHPTDPLYVLAGLQDNGTNKRTTDTRSWSSVLGGDGGVHSRDGSVPGVSFASGFTTETGLASSDPAQGATGVA